MAENYILECSGISKAFGGTQALKDVELHIRPGEVHALLGENGAGKSTLMKIIIGLYRQDEGSITWNGQPYQARGPVDAINQGISMIHQELNPEPHLTIAEAIFLKRESMRGIFLDKKAQNKRCEELLKNFGFNHSPRKLMKELTLAEVQMIEIIKAVSCDAKLIIMDEPTSSLDSEETEHLFRTIRDLKSQGVSIIYISHRMEEIFEICDRVSVFRDGMYQGSRDIADENGNIISRDELISLMVGRKVTSIFPKDDTIEIGQPVFKVEGLTGDGFEDISFEVRAGEILGLSGLVGSGRSETVRAIFGLDPLERGTMTLNGEVIKVKHPRDAIKRGICMVNEDRKGYGLCLQRSIRENISLPNLPTRQKGILINQKREKQECQEVAESLTVKCASIEHTGLSLSGGNQQKVVLAKWMMANPKVLILDEPTRGVDVGAKQDIYLEINKFARMGMAVIMISSELPEVMGMSDRILIYHEGRLNGEIMRSELEAQGGPIGQNEILDKEFGGK